MAKRRKKRKGKKKDKRLQVALALFVLVGITLVLAFPVREQIQYANYPLEHSEIVEQWAREYNVDEMLVYATIHTESGFDETAASSAGAIGLMQMTEETFDWIKGKIAPDETLVFEDLYRPEVSIRFGVYFISLCLQKYAGDISTAAAAYHSGWGTVDALLASGEYSEAEDYLQEFPYQQMSHYVYKINRSYEKYIELYRKG